MNAVHGAPRIVVIGYGNTLRGDDGLGWRVADALLRQPNSSQVQVMACHQLTIDLAGVLAEVGSVILVDAALGDTPGHITSTQVRSDHAEPHSLLHHVTPGVLLAAVEALYDTAPSMHLITVTGQSFAFEECLSPPVERVLPEVVARVHALIVEALTP